MSGGVCVVGSFMLDLVMRVRERPRRGETVFADAFGIFRGGKGFNQAVAAARCGARTAMIGRLGADEFARSFRDALTAEGIDGSGVSSDAEEGTGVATPLIEAGGSNTIVVAPRANMRLTAADIERSAGLIEPADVLLLQLEVPVEASEAAARIARRAGRTVVLNPAPARPLPDSLLALADIVTPNEVEAAAITGIAVDSIEAAFAAAEELRSRTSATVVVTLGALGAVVLDRNLRTHVAAIPVQVVDTTAAGDAFTGALGASLASGGDLRAALSWAIAAGACAVTRLGAEPSLPRLADIKALLARSRTS